MKVQRTLLLLLLISTILAACSPGHSGSSEIAFVRNGQLWTIDPNGANAFAITTDGPPVVGYTWSPTHQIVAFRTLDATFTNTQPAKHLGVHPVTGQVADVQSTLNTIGVDGGSPIPTSFSSPDIRYSNALWNASGTRILYRQTGKTNPLNPADATWVVAQNDQPAGIAAKLLPMTYAIPSFSYTTQKIVALSANGIFTTTLTGTQQHYLVHNDSLPGHPLTATLERVLWQPAHQDTAILYAIPAPATTQTNVHVDIAMVQLIMHSLNGHTTTLTTCTCTQFAWSPDGNFVLYSNGASYTLLNVNTKASFTLTGEAGSVPYWSPDSHFLLLDGPHTLTLAQIATQQQIVLLHDANTTPSTNTTNPGVNALLQPAENNLWAADGRHFLFLTHGRLQWQDGKTLNAGPGLYTVTIDEQGQVQGTPTIVDKGNNDTQAGWTYQDSNTSFLF